MPTEYKTLGVTGERHLREDEFTPEGVLTCLRTEFPEEAFHSCELLSSGWDNYAARVDDAWIFRFPRDPAFGRQQERQVLDMLAGHLSVAVPCVHFWGNRLACMGYRALEGLQPTPEQVASWPEDDVKKLGLDLATFLHECHTAISIERAQELELRRQRFDQVEALRDLLGARLSARATRLLDEVRRALPAAEAAAEPSFLYNDLHLQNFVVHPTTRRLAGVFDFGDAAWGDLSAEFRRLVLETPRLFAAVANSYERLSGHTISRERATLYAAVEVFRELAKDNPHQPVAWAQRTLDLLFDACDWL